MHILKGEFVGMFLGKCILRTLADHNLDTAQGLQLHNGSPFDGVT